MSDLTILLISAAWVIASAGLVVLCDKLMEVRR